MDKVPSHKSTAAYYAKKKISQIEINCVSFEETPVKSLDVTHPMDFCALAFFKRELGRRGP